MSGCFYLDKDIVFARISVLTIFVPQNVITMAEKIDGASSTKDSSKDNYDNTHWTRSERDSDGQTNTYVGKIGDSSGSHCHSWKTSDGETGTIHRGSCKVCDDEKNGDSGTGAQK